MDRSIGEFLRTRRERLRPEDVGLPAGSHRRTKGLRREEVAVLAGVGVSWLTRLEQGKANAVSAGVLHGLAGTLRLSSTERAHLFRLAGVHLPPAASEATVNDAHRRLVAGLDPNPAYLLDHHWNLVTWNTAEEQLFPLLAEAGAHPNLLRLFLDHGQVRDFIDDWPAEVVRLTRQFRAHVAAYPSPSLDNLTVALRAEHPEFNAAWEQHDVAPLAPHVRVINHQRKQLRFDQHRLALPDYPGWLLVIFLPIQDL